MFYLLSTYWPHILFVVSIAMGAAAAIHAAMTKEEVRAAIGWVGVIILSPIIGALLYAIAGINRIRRKSLSIRRDALLLAAEFDDQPVRAPLRGASEARRPGDAQSADLRQYDRHAGDR
jgi:cardiolipin synthase